MIKRHETHSALLIVVSSPLNDSSPSLSLSHSLSLARTHAHFPSFFCLLFLSFFSLFFFSFSSFCSFRSGKQAYPSLRFIYKLLRSIKKRHGERCAAAQSTTLSSSRAPRGTTAPSLLTVVHLHVILLHGVHVGDVVHRHQAGEHRHHHLRLHLGYVFG